MKIKVSNRYGTVPVELLNNKEISLRAKGLYAYIQSKPDNWKFSSERIALDSCESIDIVKKILRELEQFGYLIREKIHDTLGRWDIEYTLLAESKGTCTVGALSNDGKSNDGKSVDGLIPNNSKLENSKLDISKKEGDKPLADFSELKEESEESGTGFALRDIWLKVPKTKKDIAEFITSMKPSFREPYFELWDMLAVEIGKKQMSSYPVTTHMKISKFIYERHKELAFDFVAILKKIKETKFLHKESFNLEWVVKNDENYTKVLNGVFDENIKNNELKDEPTAKSKSELEQLKKLIKNQ
ncbi:helix-turn-helix domain-containing protein [Polluticaenibacter yanchengensis]|uniref:Helix-turn-helix domain-containing protein n=1 Tax=Polluticaenibacter yanchengensis TaxID=3014562 RepID=A0ABT4UIM5_9BACT|nr:hypothetical protein [Chitinophagaceae bacterium LY-5]